jgi:type 1 glutamine amidotransferase/mono/diheme cytochrome c family protein
MHSSFTRLGAAFCALVAGLMAAGPLHSEEPVRPRKVVLIAGKKSHGPEGNGIHDYPWSARLLKVLLDNSNVGGQLAVEYHLNGWPEDPTTFDDADTIMVISDGRDGDKYVEAPHFRNPVQTAWIEKQMKRGCGFITFHFSTFAPDSQAARILNWSGGYFDWENDGKREWYSDIKTLDAPLRLASPKHPVCRGVKPFQLREEFYFNIRFAAEDERLHSILEVPALPGREPDGRVVAWAREREDGGRGFGTTCGHFYDNWKNPDFRRLILNAIAWTAKVEVPAEGVQSEFFSHHQIQRALAGVQGVASSSRTGKPIKALIVTGHQYPGHKWQLTTPVLREALMKDPRIEVSISENVEDLALAKVREFDLIVFNYCNWQKPGLSDDAKAGFTSYLAGGGGLILIHFANGAFHFSLPEAAESDWPEFRKICRRVWDHTEGKSGHDAYGSFKVQIQDPDHDITRGLQDFETIDELYFRQQGELPIHVLTSARSKVTGNDEPMAFVYEYGQGRVMQTVLGHADESLKVDAVQELIKRSAIWVAGRKQASAKPDQGRREGLQRPTTFVAIGQQQSPAASSQERPGRLPKEVRDRLAAGVVTSVAAVDATVFSDARPDRMAAIHVAKDSVVSPFLATGPFRLQWSGFVKTRLQGEFQFRVEGQGSVSLKLNGVTVLETLETTVRVALHKGYNTLQLDYDSPTEQAARCVLMWAGDGFGMEAIPPAVLWHDTDHSLLASSQQLRAGRRMFAQHQCQACHRLPGADQPAANAMPDLQRSAPSLVMIGTRVTSDWMEKWLSNPASLRANATMPDVLHGLEEEQRPAAIRDLMAYLLGLVEEPAGELLPSREQETVDAGAVLFEDLGCISCHRLSEPAAEDYFKRVTLWFAGQKYRPGAMVSFLQAPRKHYPWSRMPEFHLSFKEAEALAAFIRAKSAPANPTSDPVAGNIFRGKELVQSLGCANCHELRPLLAPTEKRKSPFASEAGQGCMNVTDAGGGPAFKWSRQQHDAMSAFLATDGSSLLQENPLEASSRFVTELNCVACHRRDERYADWPEVLFEEGVQGHPPENVPQLTWAGEKLRVDWMLDLFAGRLPYKSRPWLKARMPTFPARGDLLATGISAQHGLGPEPTEPADVDKATLSIADSLTRKDGGLDCRQCHAMAGEVLKMENQAHGVSFGYIRHRIRYSYYQRWMLDPLRYDPATKMPRYSPDRQTTAIKHVFEGDARRQFDALWQFLETTRLRFAKPEAE